MLKKLKGALRNVLLLLALVCFACAVCVLGTCFDGSGSRRAGLDESQKGLLLIAYVLASMGLALWIGTGWWLKDKR